MYRTLYHIFETRGRKSYTFEFNLPPPSILLSADIVLRLVVPYAPGKLFTRARFAANMGSKVSNI